MELVLAIISLLATGVGIWWALYQSNNAKKKKEGERRVKEDQKAQETRQKAQSEQISDVEAHEHQEESEAEWRAMREKQLPGRMVIHCSASKNGAGHSARTIDHYHRKERKFLRIGYHKVIQPSGFLEDHTNSPCRPEDMVGAGVKGANRGSIHICMIGTDKFPLIQLEKLRKLVLDLKMKYQMSNADIRCHYEFNSAIQQGKTCPNMDREKLIKWITQDSIESIKKYILETNG